MVGSEVLDLLDLWDDQSDRPPWQQKKEPRAAVLISLLRGFTALGDETLGMALVARVHDRPLVYPLHESRIEVLRVLAIRDAVDQGLELLVCGGIQRRHSMSEVIMTCSARSRRQAADFPLLKGAAFLAFGAVEPSRYCRSTVNRSRIPPAAARTPAVDDRP